MKETMSQSVKILGYKRRYDREGARTIKILDSE